MSIRLKLLRSVRDFGADTSGATAVIVGLTLPMVIGGFGLGAETGYWYYTHRKLQHAADVAAHAGAVRVRSGERAQIYAAALNVAQGTGFSPSFGSVTVHSPPISGPHTGKPLFVEVIVTETRPRLLTSLFGSSPVVFSTRAVAGLSAESSAACVLALSRTAPRAVNIGGSTAVQVNDCDVAANSNATDAFEMVGSASALAAGCIQSVGGAIPNSNLTLTRCTKPYVSAPPVRDPYADVPEPTVEGPCVNSASVRDTTVTPSFNHSSGVKSIRFCNGFRFQGTVFLKPGLYIIDGNDFDSNGNSSLQLAPKDLNEPDPGVTIYITNGAALKISANAEYNLSGSTTGPYKGILFFGSRTSAASEQQINGTASSRFEGAIYMPASNVQFSGNADMQTGCTQLIGDTVTLTGNSKFFHSCSGSVTQPIRTDEKVVVSE